MARDKRWKRTLSFYWQRRKQKPRKKMFMKILMKQTEIPKKNWREKESSLRLFA